jgi:hypothetical protein
MAYNYQVFNNKISLSAKKTEYVTCGSVIKLLNTDYKVGFPSFIGFNVVVLNGKCCLKLKKFACIYIKNLACIPKYFDLIGKIALTRC